MSYGLDSIGSSSYANYSSLFKKLDSNSDGSVNKSEFVDGAPDSVDKETASKLFDLIDQSSSGELSQSDIASAFNQIATDLKSILLDAQESSNKRKTPGNDIFAKIDTNGDSLVSKEEFIAGKPQDVSEEQASSLYDQIAGDNTDGLTEEQLSSGISKNGGPKGPPAGGPPPGGPPPSGGAGGSDETEQSSSSDTDDTEETLLEQLLKELNSSSEDSSGTSVSTILQAISAYKSAA
jgi:Ca2+-binding EF-hand superfamily protein